jgi:hypothetical protein
MDFKLSATQHKHGYQNEYQKPDAARPDEESTPLETPAMTHPVSDSTPKESKVSSTDARIVEAVEIVPERESDFIFPPLFRDRRARFAAGPF